MGDFLIDCLTAGIVYYAIACCFYLASPYKMVMALFISFYVLVPSIVIPIIIDGLFGTHILVTLADDRIATLIGVLFVMPGIGFLAGKITAWWLR